MLNLRSMILLDVHAVESKRAVSRLSWELFCVVDVVKRKEKDFEIGKSFLVCDQ